MSIHRITVIELKAEAKRRGLHGYSKLRKAELINLLREGNCLVVQQEDLHKVVMLRAPPPHGNPFERRFSDED